jgi:hypothetical protein
MIHVELLREKGILIVVPQGAPAADASLIEHMKFVRDHHRKIERVGAVTDNGFIKVARDIRQFGSDEEARALAWLETGRR